MQSIQNQLAGFREKGRRFEKWKKIVTALSCVVVFCTVYALILPAITMEGDTYCEKEEHTHSEECYKEVVASVEKQLVCTLEEAEPHTHSDGCYEIRTIEETIEVPVETAEPETASVTEEATESEEPAAVSETEEAIETAEPATVSETTTETVTETIVTEEKVLVCEKAETEGHAHADECYEEVEVYGEPELDCTKEEHEHSIACYSNPNADVETEAEWKKTFADVTFTKDWVEDTLAIAKTQLGYNESNDNYIVLENGDTKGYSRYGDWYGNSYGDWCAMFVSFCLNYAGVEDFPLEAGCQNWIVKIKELEEASKDADGVVQYNAWQEATDDYIPERGNIICFNWDSESDADHVGIVVGTTTDNNGNTTITTIEGNTSDTVDYQEYALENSTIMGYGILPAQEFYCEMQGHVHDKDCYNDANEVICGFEEHIHTEECEEKQEASEEELSERVKRVIELIDKLPTYEEFEAKLLEYENAEDMDGYEAYYKEISDQATSAYVLYEDLNEENRAKVTNIDKLMEFEWMWSASTFQVEQGIAVYQVNTYADNSVPVLFYGKSADDYGEDMTFAYWSAIVVEEKEDGTLYVSECYATANVDKSGYGPKTNNGFVLLVHDSIIDYPELDLEVGDIVSVPFDYTQTLAYDGESYGTISFTDPQGNESKLKVVEGADTRDLITVNLYDYSDNINIPYNRNQNYPGFQQDNGQETSTDTHYSNFGNNITEDLAAGLAGLTIANGSNINATVDGGEGLANRPNSGMMLPTLGSDGYPALADGTSLQYLFNKDSDYTTKKNTQSINGLFLYNEKTGAYTFNSRENHAQFNKENDTFTLYDQIISSNFIWYPFGNFLPFNDIVHQSTQASTIDKEYFQIIATRARNKYKQGLGAEYLTLATSLESWIALMDAEYPNGWSGADAMNEYFNNNGPGKKEGILFDFSSQIELLDKVYSIDYDEATDFYFGMEMRMNFIQPKDGLTGLTGQEPMVFEFTGDDDVWVYVDGKLFLDLSGIHRHVGGTIDFVNGVVKYYALDVKTGDVATEPYKTQKFSEILGTTDGLNAKGTFENYSSHTFNFYYMERGAGSGVCRMNFNFPLLRQNSISVGKEVSSDTEILGNPDYKFQVLKADSNGNKTEELFITSGTTYTIYDQNDKAIGTGTTDANGVFILKAGQRAEFTGIKENAGKYYVRELLDGTVLGQYGNVIVSGESTTTSNNVTVGSDTFTGMDSPVKDMSDGATAFRFTNDVKEANLGTLNISKKVTTYPQTKDVKYFDIQVKLDGDLLPVGTEYTVDSKTRTVETAGIITIAADETATISNILAGTEFTAQETSGSAEGYTVTYTDSGGYTITVNDGIVSGIIKTSANVQLVVTNSEKGATIVIPGTKTIVNPDGGNHTYNFQMVEVTDSTGSTLKDDGSVKYSAAATVDKDSDIGNYAFTINYVAADFETLPQKFYYKITEQDADDSLANNTAYVVEVTVSEAGSGISAAITGMWKDEKVVSATDSGYSADFENTLAGDLILSKVVEGDQTSEQEFTFEIKFDSTEAEEKYSAILKKADGTTENTTVAFIDGSANVQLEAGESLQLLDVVYGTKWIITETNADGYKVTYDIILNEETVSGKGTESSGTISVGTTNVTYTNEKQYELPEAGGSGTKLFIIGGLTLICCAMFLLYNNKKCGKEETASS